MAKRRLTQQQRRRIAERQQRRAQSLRAQPDPAAAELGAEQAGLIIAHYGRELDVEALEQPLAGTVVRCRMRANLEPLVTGDRVVWQPELASLDDDEPSGVVVAGLPRRSVLTRPDSHSGLPRPVAANIDEILIVIAPEPTPFANLIDRYLVAAEQLGIEPVIVLNKSDLITPERQPELEALLAMYQRIGYRTLTASTVADSGLDALRAALRDRTGILVGQSGVGKSSLIAALLPGVDIRIGALSEAESKGRHTTTTARLFHLPDGGDLIDSPGIREFGLEHLDRAQIERGFVEFHPWLGRCRFRDCAHEQEPGCALHEALANGDIDPRRMESYRAILSSLAT